MNLLSHKLLTLRRDGKKALSMFVTAGYPSVDTTVEIVEVLESGGADIIEIGIPFSDPLADGPTIQHASDVALKNGITVEKVFALVKSIRSNSSIPLVLMGYINPILAYGFERFAADASAAGADGIIIPDLPVEESELWCRFARSRNISTIFLAAPTTSVARLQLLDEKSDGFVYCVSVTGVTGERNGLPTSLREYLKRCREVIRKNPILVGFGISTEEDVNLIAPYADGVIVGSALINLLRSNTGFKKIGEFTKKIRHALDKRS